MTSLIVWFILPSKSITISSYLVIQYRDVILEKPGMEGSSALMFFTRSSQLRILKLVLKLF